MNRGKVWKYGDNIDTDRMYPGKYLVSFEREEVEKHALEGLDSEFAKKVKRGDIVVFGRNAGCGSAREQAVSALKYLGVSAILAESFARTFFRNGIDLGLPMLTVRGISVNVENGHELEVDLAAGLVKNLTTGQTLKSKPLPSFILEILSEGGIIPYYRKMHRQR